jgi:hypothetical protein
MNIRLAILAALLAATNIAHAQFDAEKEKLVGEAKKFANQRIECLNYLAPHQCNSMDRCVATKDLLSQVANGSSSLAQVNEYTTNKNNCACVRSFMGHNYITKILDTHGALPHDERYKGCYGQ